MSQELEQAEKRLRGAKANLFKHDRLHGSPLGRSRILLEIARCHQVVQALTCSDRTKATKNQLYKPAPEFVIRYVGWIAK
jgi:hypothetical protein